MAKIGASTKRISQLNGGINQLDSNSEVADNEAVVCDGFNFDGNRLVTLKGYEEYTELVGTEYVKGISQTGDYLFVVYGTKFRTIHIPTGEIKDFNFTFSADRCNVTVGRVFDYFIVVTDIKGENDLVLLRYTPNDSDFNASTCYDITSSMSGLTNKKFTCAGFYNGKMLLGGNPINPALYYSKTSTVSTENDIFNFNGLDSSSQYIGDGSPITGFKAGQDNFYIFKRDSVYQITNYIQNTHTNTSTNPTTGVGTTSVILDSVAYQVKRIANNGAINQQVIQNVEQDIIYFDGENFRRISYEQQSLAIKDQAISEKIYNLIRVLPKDQSVATALYVYPYYKIYLRSLTNGSNDIAFIYNVITKSWSTQSNVSVSVATSSIRNKYDGYIGSLNSGLVWKDNTSHSLDGLNLVGVYESKVFDCGDAVDYKRFTEIELDGRISPGLSVWFDFILDGVVIDSREIKGGGIYQPTTGSTTIGATTVGAAGNNEDDLEPFRARYEYYHDARNYQFRLRYEGVGRFELDSHHFTFKFVSPYDIHY